MRKTAGQPDRVYRVVTDQLGSPVFVVNIATPTDVWLDATYDAWGNVKAFKLDGVDQGTSLANWPIPHAFAGGLLDVDTGLVRFGARDYEPVIGRWTARDPILFEGGQANLYVYVGNDAANFVDLQGTGPLDSWQALAGHTFVGLGLLSLATGGLSPIGVGLLAVGVGFEVWDAYGTGSGTDDKLDKVQERTRGFEKIILKRNQELEEVLREGHLGRPVPLLSKEGQESCDEARKAGAGP